MITYSGGDEVILQGVGLSDVRSIQIGGVIISEYNYTGASGQLVSSRRLLQTATGEEQLIFTSPFIPSTTPASTNTTAVTRRSSYQSLTLALLSNSSSGGLTSYIVPGLLYATASSCVKEGQFKQLADGTCAACPGQLREEIGAADTLVSFHTATQLIAFLCLDCL